MSIVNWSQNRVLWQWLVHAGIHVLLILQVESTVITSKRRERATIIPDSLKNTSTRCQKNPETCCPDVKIRPTSTNLHSYQVGSFTYYYHSIFTLSHDSDLVPKWFLHLHNTYLLYDFYFIVPLMFVRPSRSFWPSFVSCSNLCFLQEWSCWKTRQILP